MSTWKDKVRERENGVEKGGRKERRIGKEVMNTKDETLYKMLGRLV